MKIIRYQLTEKNYKDFNEFLTELEEAVFIEEIWSQIENTPQHEKHNIRCKVHLLQKILRDKVIVVKKQAQYGDAKNLWKSET